MFDKFFCSRAPFRFHNLLLFDSFGELCACNLMEILGVTRPMVSHHLAQPPLGTAAPEQAVVDPRQSQWVYYRIRVNLPQWAHRVLETTVDGVSGMLPYRDDPAELVDRQAGADEPCRPRDSLPVTLTERSMNILFLCTGNSSPSRMAEGWSQHLAPKDWAIQSTNIETHEKNPRAIAVMKEAGIDISGQGSTRVTNAMLEVADLVVTVCRHADEYCPVRCPVYARNTGRCRIQSGLRVPTRDHEGISD